MKAIKIMSLTALAVFAVAGVAHALDLGSSIGNKVKDGAQAGSKIAIEKQINKDLAAKNCSFTPKTTELNCDLNDILKTLKDQKTVAEQSGFSSGVDIYAKVGEGNDSKNPSLGSQRMTKVRTELIKKVSWWDWNDTTVTGDKLELSVKIH
jgi:uncharacterized protein YjhX (UPF0386 family)